MTLSASISSSQTHLNLNLNLSSRKSSFMDSIPPSHRPFSFNINPHLTTPKFSIRTNSPNFTPKAAATATANSFYTPATEKNTLYDLLGVSQSGTISDIKRAYKQMALKYHPDVSPPDRAEEYTVRFIRVQEAYETLSDPEARAMYDSGMAKGLHLAFSGKKGARFDPRSDERSGWKDMWEVQVSELTRKSKMNTSRVDRGGRMSWGARIRNQRSESCAQGSDQQQ